MAGQSSFATARCALCPHRCRVPRSAPQLRPRCRKRSVEPPTGPCFQRCPGTVRPSRGGKSDWVSGLLSRLVWWPPYQRDSPTAKTGSQS